MEDFDEPADMQNFLARYHEARAASRSAPTTPKQTTASPPSPPSPRSPSLAKLTPSRKDAARSIWGSVFHPLGKSPTSADRYDLSPGQTSTPGMSASEVHAKGTGISLDAKNDD